MCRLGHAQARAPERDNPANAHKKAVVTAHNDACSSRLVGVALIDDEHLILRRVGGVDSGRRDAFASLGVFFCSSLGHGRKAATERGDDIIIIDRDDVSDNHSCDVLELRGMDETRGRQPGAGRRRR